MNKKMAIQTSATDSFLQQILFTNLNGRKGIAFLGAKMVV